MLSFKGTTEEATDDDPLTGAVTETPPASDNGDDDDDVVDRPIPVPTPPTPPPPEVFFRSFYSRIELKQVQVSNISRSNRISEIPIIGSRPIKVITCLVDDCVKLMEG